MKIKFSVIFLLLFTSFAKAQGRQESNSFYEHTNTGNQKSISQQVSYYKCPKCDNFVSRISLPSYNTTEAKFYTDGKITGSSYRERPEVVICDNCKYPFWMKDDFADKNCFQSLVFSPDGYSLVLKSQKAVFYGPETYDKFIRNRVYCSRDEEKYLLTRYWWALNDRVRNKLVFLNDPCESDTAKVNLNRLIDILEEENEELFAVQNRAGGDNFEYSILLVKSLRSIRGIFEILKPVYDFAAAVSGEFDGLTKSLYVDNIKRMKALNRNGLETFNANLLTIAELHRNLGRFEKCLETISYADSDSKLIRHRTAFMSEQCENKLKIVSEL